MQTSLFTAVTSPHSKKHWLVILRVQWVILHSLQKVGVRERITRHRRIKILDKRIQSCVCINTHMFVVWRFLFPLFENYDSNNMFSDEFIGRDCDIVYFYFFFPYKLFSMFLTTRGSTIAKKKLLCYKICFCLLIMRYAMHGYGVVFNVRFC